MNMNTLEVTGISKCQNCRTLTPTEELFEPDRLWERVAPGEPMPSGECPECRALCHPLVIENDEGLLEAVLYSAETHGNDTEAEHEVDDLIELVQVLWEYLEPAGRRQAVQHLLEIEAFPRYEGQVYEPICAYLGIPEEVDA